MEMEIVEQDADDVMEISVPPDDENNDDLMIDTVRLRPFLSMPVHKQMITHVVWPRQLPSKDTETSVHETALIALMTDTLDWFENENECLKSIAKMFRGLFNTNTSSDAEIIAMEINRLKHGDMFGCFVKQQSCGISIYIQPNVDKSSVQPKSAIVSTFPLTIPNEEIYAAKHSDFQVIF